MRFLYLVLFFAAFAELLKNSSHVAGSKILSLAFYSSQSHMNVYKPLLNELANRGHNITLISSINSKIAHQNIREINGIKMEDVLEFDMFDMRMKKEFLNPLELGPYVARMCKSYYKMPEVQEILNEKFDLITVSSFINECTFGLIHRLNTTFIIIHPFAPPFWTSSIMGAPSLPSFIPLTFFGQRDRMDFRQRVFNFIAYVYFGIYNRLIYLPIIETNYREFIGQDTPDFRTIAGNASLMLMNSHFSLNYARPVMPDMIDVGGMHCRSAEPLPKDLNDFLSGAGNDGFIYFSMGSVLQAHKMPESHRKIFVNVFSKLKQRVIWKWEKETMPDLPQNVKISKWCPQQDILGHPNIRMFITHGGLLSTEEAVYHGVPLLGLPMFGDQDWNMKQSVTNGFALSLEFGDLSVEIMLQAIQRILTEPQFKDRAKHLSKIFTDRPQKPLDTAVFWTEYVIRHKGAIHLRSPARDLNIFQYHSIDVIAAILITLFTMIYIMYLIIRLVISIFYGKSKYSNSSSSLPSGIRKKKE